MPYTNRLGLSKSIKPINPKIPPIPRLLETTERHVRLDSRVGPILSTVTFDDKGKKRKIMYEGSLGGMIVPYGDLDGGWYFKAYLDSGDYGMGTTRFPIN